MAPFTKMIPELKMSETETHVFFLNGPFSQWYPSVFDQRFAPGEAKREFHCAEQFMMAAKAHLFGDVEVLEQIMNTPQDPKDWRVAPKLFKELGQKVKGFDEDTWVANRERIVLKGNMAKFFDDEDLLAFLLNTGDKQLVEGAWYDRVWGVKLAWDDPMIVDPANWKGLNLLGKILMRVRYVLGASQ